MKLRNTVKYYRRSAVWLLNVLKIQFTIFRFAQSCGLLKKKCIHPHRNISWFLAATADGWNEAIFMRIAKWHISPLFITSSKYHAVFQYIANGNCDCVTALLCGRRLPWLRTDAMQKLRSVSCACVPSVITQYIGYALHTLNLRCKA